MKNSEWVREIEVIGWDLDGTLYPNNEGLRREIDRLKFEKVAEVNEWSVARAKSEYEKVHEKISSHTKTLYELGVDGVEFFVGMWDEIELEKYIKPDKKVVEMFEKLKSKRHFMLSNSNREDQIERKLKLIGLDMSVFELVVETVDLGVTKPDPKPYEICLEKLEVEASKVLFVGDRDRTDILGAKNVRMRTCLVWGESKVADISLSKVYDVAKLFKGKA